MVRLLTLLTSLLLLLISTTALPIADPEPEPQHEDPTDIMRRLAALFQSAQAKTQPPASTPPLGDPSGVLKYIALGLGTQNYTCATADASSTPVATGAKANLFDATSVMVAAANSKLGTDNKAMSAGTCLADQHNTAGNLSQIGQHYFDAAGVPTFDLASESMLLKAKKMATSPAPSGACAGRDQAPAVPWLMLADNGAGQSQGLSQVFRVETAGGTATTCVGQPVGPQGFTLDYAALYYLYGPSS